MRSTPRDHQRSLEAVGVSFPKGRLMSAKSLNIFALLPNNGLSFKARTPGQVPIQGTKKTIVVLCFTLYQLSRKLRTAIVTSACENTDI